MALFSIKLKWLKEKLFDDIIKVVKDIVRIDLIKLDSSRVVW